MEGLLEIVSVLLEGIMDIFDGTSGTETAPNNAVRKWKKISLIIGIVSVCGAAIALMIYLVSRIV